MADHRPSSTPSSHLKPDTPEHLSNAVPDFDKAFSGPDAEEMLNAALDRADQLAEHPKPVSTQINPMEWGRWAGDWMLSTVDPPPAPMLLAWNVHKRTSPEGREEITVADGEGYLPAGIVGLIAATGGTGKTALLCHLALCIATGKRFLGRVCVVNPGPVVLALGEEDEGEMHRRLSRAAKAMGLSEHERHQAGHRIFAMPLAGRSTRLVGLAGTGASTGELLIQRLHNLLMETHSTPKEWRAILLDPLSRFGGYDMETDNAAATEVVTYLERLVRYLPGCPTVIAAHHTRKTEKSRLTADSVRGSSGLKDGARWLAMIEPNEEAVDGGERGAKKRKVTLRVVKANAVSMGSRITFDLVEGVVHPVGAQTVTTQDSYANARRNPYD